MERIRIIRKHRSALLASLALTLLLIQAGTAAAQRPGVVEQWAEVLSVTPKWLVLQNQKGEQYPVSFEAVGLFLIRFPTTVDRIAPDALVEATGVDRGSNRIGVDHVDVFEGGARGMVAPGLLYITGSGRSYRPIDFTFNSDAYGDPFPGLGPPIQGGVNTGPAMTHLVGPVLNRFPLILGIEGNNRIVVLPLTPAGFSVSRIVPGSPGLVRPGDLVFFSAVEARPKSLILEQLIVYKRLPADQFDR
jgi:hypothetical protein